MIWKRRLLAAGIAAAVYLGYRYIFVPAIPFLAAWVISGFLFPFVRKLELKYHIKRTWSGAVILGLAIGIALFFVYLGVREAAAQGMAILNNIPLLFHRCACFLDSCCFKVEEMTGIDAGVTREFFLNQTEKIQSKIVSTVGGWTASGLWLCARSLAAFLAGVFLTYILSIVMLGEMEKLRRTFRESAALRSTRRILKRLGDTVLTYIKAQIIIVLLISLVCAAGFRLLKNPYFLVLGGVLGVLDLLPFIGTGTFLYPTALFFLIQGKKTEAVICIVLDLITSLLRETLEPRLLGVKLGISPILILVSVYSGILLYGAWGVLLGPLTFSTIYEIGRENELWGKGY